MHTIENYPDVTGKREKLPKIGNMICLRSENYWNILQNKVFRVIKYDLRNPDYIGAWLRPIDRILYKCLFEMYEGLTLEYDSNNDAFLITINHNFDVVVNDNDKVLLQQLQSLTVL
jgi:hypothetical protein